MDIVRHAAGSVQMLWGDSSLLFLEMLPVLALREAGLEVVGRGSTPMELREEIRRSRPDLCVLDARLFREAPRQFCDELSVRLGQTRLAVFADDLTDVQLDQLLLHNVHGVLSKRDSLQALTDQLRRLSQKDRVVTQQLSHRIEKDAQGRYQVVTQEEMSRLTDRQLAVLVQLATGRSVREIAEEMQLSEKAVESHKFRLMNRLGFHNRVELCRWAIREGLIDA
jgi:two-component system invasion response regulator UvrY